MLSVKNMNGDISSPYLGNSTNRWLDNLSNEEHHSLPCVSSSQIKYLHKNSEQAFYRKYVTREFKEQGSHDSFRVGTLIHLAILEPEKFERYVRVCDIDQRTKDFRDYRQELIDHLNGKLRVVVEKIEDSETGLEIKIKKSRAKTKDKVLVEAPAIAEVEKPESLVLGKNGGYLLNNGEELYLVKSSEMVMYRAIQRNCERHSRLSIMLEDCVIEQSGVAECPRTGLYLSCRGDARRGGAYGYFIDPKSMNKLSENDIGYAIKNYSYHIQHIHYLYVANLIEPGIYKFFYFLFVSKENYEVTLFHLTPQDIAMAEKLYFSLLDRIANCSREKKWRSLDNGNGLSFDIPYLDRA